MMSLISGRSWLILKRNSSKTEPSSILASTPRQLTNQWQTRALLMWGQLPPLNLMKQGGMLYCCWKVRMLSLKRLLMMVKVNQSNLLKTPKMVFSEGMFHMLQYSTAYLALPAFPSSISCCFFCITVWNTQLLVMQQGSSSLPNKMFSRAVYRSSSLLAVLREYYSLSRTSVRNLDLGLEMKDHISTPGNSYTLCWRASSQTIVELPPITLLREKVMTSGAGPMRLTAHFSWAMCSIHEKLPRKKELVSIHMPPFSQMMKRRSRSAQFCLPMLCFELRYMLSRRASPS